MPRSIAYPLRVLSPGTQIDRFELVCPVGEGGMAQVWIARQRGAHGFEKLFALKAIHPRYADDARFRAMFLDEARIAAAIHHPNVAQIYDLGEVDAHLYIVMEYVDGESVSDLLTTMELKGTRATTPPIALKIVTSVCAGLDAAHRLTDPQGRPAGVVHRDVSPHNILISSRGDVKLIDFGIAKLIAPEGGETDSGILKGKLYFMAPEQVRREPLGPATDVFGAGAVLFRLLSGHSPYDVESESATLGLLLARKEHPRRLPPEVPPVVAAIVERALAPDPGDRYATTSELQRAIDRAAQDAGYAVDLSYWVRDNLSERTRARQRSLAAAPAEPRGGTAALAPPMRLPGPPGPSTMMSGASGAPPQMPPGVTHGSFGTTPMRTDADPAALPLGLAPTEDLRVYREPLRAVGAQPQDIGNQIPEDPGFMDVRALVAQRRGAAPNPEPQRERTDMREPPRRGRDLEAATGGYVPDVVPAVVGTGDVGTPVKSRLPLVIAVAGGLLALVVVALLVAPSLVKKRVIAQAKSAGVDLTIGDVAIGISGVRLTKIKATIPSIPAFEAQLDEASSDFRAKRVQLSGVDVKIDGPLVAVGQELVIFYGTHRGAFAGTATDPRHVAVVHAHVGWTELFGKGTKLDAGEVTLALDTKNVDEIHANLGRFQIETPKATFGPWALAFDRDATTTRARLSFDPPVPDGPSALWVAANKETPTITVRIPRAPIATLGLHPEAFGLPLNGSNEIEAKIESAVTDERVSAHAKIDLYGVKPSAAKAPIDVKLDASFAGKVGKPLDIEKTTLTVGPFVAAVGGTITPQDAGLRVDATFKTVPISCLRLVRPEVKSWGPMAATIADIALQTGAVRVTGDAQAAGTVAWETATPDEPIVEFTVKETCGLSIFGL